MTEEGYTAPDISLVGDEHVRRYRETDGEVGHEWNGVLTLLLTTTGRRSGETRPRERPLDGAGRRGHVCCRETRKLPGTAGVVNGRAGTEPRGRSRFGATRSGRTGQGHGHV